MVVTAFLKSLFIAEVCYTWTIVFVKFSILAFYSNREHESITTDMFRYAYGLLQMMKFPEDKMLLRWYPDIDETVCHCADSFAVLVGLLLISFYSVEDLASC